MGRMKRLPDRGPGLSRCCCVSSPGEQGTSGSTEELTTGGCKPETALLLGGAEVPPTACNGVGVGNRKSPLRHPAPDAS